MQLPDWFYPVQGPETTVLINLKAFSPLSPCQVGEGVSRWIQDHHRRFNGTCPASIRL